MTSTDSSQRDERGFTIVEIIVAVTIVVLVLGGVVWMVMGSSKAEQRSDIRQKMAAAADGLSQQVRSNKDWLEASMKADPKHNCKTQMCTPQPESKYSYRPKSSNDPKFTTKIEVSPLDSPMDGLANLDNDHILPDLYKISITVTLSAEEQAIWGKQLPFNLTSTVDATTIGKGSGSLTVQVCRVDNQVDERMAIAGCKDKAQQLEMRYQPPCAPDETLTGEQVPLMVAGGKTLPLSCNGAIHQTKDIKLHGWAPGSVEVEPAKNVNFQIAPVSGHGLAMTSELANKVSDDVDGDDGSWVFEGLGTGDYQIKLTNMPAGMELWKSHVVPQDLKVSIQNNQHAKALVIIRPVQGTGTYTVAFSREVTHYTINMKTKIVINGTPDPVHDAMVMSRTTYKYLYAQKVGPIPMPGASWNGYIAMEPKPFDRYRQDGAGALAVNQQRIMPVNWGTPAVTFTGLPTGLFSRPEQLSVNQTAMWGQFDKLPFMREAQFGLNKMYDKEGVPLDIFGALNFIKGGGDMLCVPGLRCGTDYVYIDEHGVPNSSMLFNDAANGECWVTSAVPQVPIAGLEIMGGLEQENTGVKGADRCERDFNVNGVRIFNFFPNRDGEAGQIVLWRSTMDQWCVPMDQCIPIVDVDRTMIPVAVPDITPDPLLPTPLRTDMSPLVRPSDEQIARGIASMGMDPPPPPSIQPTLSVNPLMALNPILANVPLTKEEQSAKQGCMKYMENFHKALNMGQTREQLAAMNAHGLNCNKQCPIPDPSNPYAGQTDLAFDQASPTGWKTDASGAYRGAPSGGIGGDSAANFASEFDQTPCPTMLPGQNKPVFEPPRNPGPDARPITGPNPDTAGFPLPATGFALPALNGGTHAANGRTGVVGG
jgi:type II secretory pathway pseudopilin PulG